MINIQDKGDIIADKKRVCCLNALCPLYTNCRCIIERLKAIYAGTATNDGVKGADWYLINYGKLPNCYIYHTFVEIE